MIGAPLFPDRAAQSLGGTQNLISIPWPRAAPFPLLPVFTAGDNGVSSASGNCRMTAFRIIGAIATDGGNDLCEGYLL